MDLLPPLGAFQDLNSVPQDVQQVFLPAEPFPASYGLEEAGHICEGESAFPKTKGAWAPGCFQFLSLGVGRSGSVQCPHSERKRNRVWGIPAHSGPGRFLCDPFLW